MNNNTIQLPWEYTGTPDNVLARHDHTQRRYTPLNYPDLSDKKWWAVQHQHKKALRVLADNAIRQSQLEEREEEILKIDKENSLSRLLFVLEKIRNDRQEKASKAAEYQRTTLRSVAQVKSGNTNTGMTQFAQRATELETMDTKAVAYMWWMLQHNVKNTTSKKTRKNILEMLQLIKDVMIKRNIPTQWAELTKLISTITEDELKGYLKLYK